MTPSLKAQLIHEVATGIPSANRNRERKGRKTTEGNNSRAKEKSSEDTKSQKKKSKEHRHVLSRSDARHVVVLGQRREVLVQLLDALLVRFGATFAFEAVVEL